MRQKPPLLMYQNRAYWGQITFASIEFDLNSRSTRSVYTYGNSFLHSPTIEVIIFIKIDTSRRGITAAAELVFRKWRQR